ncbi:hypothetical protein EV174_000771 [Coemansia sp. RSA 2320]|nr:hypothetical protein EV174_000771 [Coemansia sp. RSA 2320]
MARFNLRSFALMALAVVAAASPAANLAAEATALSAPAVANVAASAPIAIPADASRKLEVAVPNAPAVQQPQMDAVSKLDQSEKVDMSKMGVWVPCSESECMKGMTPEQQQAFKRDCEKMQLTQQKSGAGGQSRLSKADTALQYWQMIIPEKDLGKLKLGNQRLSMVPTTHVIDGKAVGNRPTGKNLS